MVHQSQRMVSLLCIQVRSSSLIVLKSACELVMLIQLPAARTPPVLPWPDIGHLAKWSVSSYKFGFGAECLRDGDPDTFWQWAWYLFGVLGSTEEVLSSSDGPQPHFITVEFPRKVAIQVQGQFRMCCQRWLRSTQKISIYLSWPQDDSYTPSTLAIRAGTGPSDLQDVRVATLEKPDGWITFDVSSEPDEDGNSLWIVFPMPLSSLTLL